MRRLITVIGTDGSGKTTLSDSVANRLSARDLRAARSWLGAESVLMAPARIGLKCFWNRPQHPVHGATADDVAQAQDPPDYANEIAAKNGLVNRYPWAVRPYVALVMADYRLQVAIKLWKNRNVDLVVADRYLFDVAVNLGLTLGWTPEMVVRFVQRQLKHFLVPQVRVFLRVEPEVSMARKDDIPDVAYLRLRLSYYDAIAAAFGFTVRDGTLPIDQNAEWLMGHLNKTFSRPYVHYVHSNNADVGGADKVLALMARHMRDFGSHGGHRVAISLRLATEAVDEYVRLGIPVLLSPFVRPQVSDGARGVVRSLGLAPGTFLYFRRLFARECPDIVHVNDLYDLLPAAAARTLGIPVVYHIRMIQMNRRVRKVFSHLVPRLSSVSVSVSTAVRNHYFQAPDSEAHVIHDLANAHLAGAAGDVTRASQRPGGLTSGGRLVVMVGRIEPWKGQDVFLNAVSLLPREVRADHVFALVGGPVPGKTAFLEDVHARAVALGVHVLGNRADVPDILRAADVSVHCSVSPDPYPGVVIESLLSGAATVAADGGGVPEIVADRENGLMVRPGDAKALAESLRDLLVHPRTPRERYGPKGRQRGLALVDAKIIDAQIDNLYAGLAPRSNLDLRSAASASRTGAH